MLETSGSARHRATTSAQFGGSKELPRRGPALHRDSDLYKWMGKRVGVRSAVHRQSESCRADSRRVDQPIIAAAQRTQRISEYQLSRGRQSITALHGDVSVCTSCIASQDICSKPASRTKGPRATTSCSTSASAYVDYRHAISDPPSAHCLPGIPELEMSLVELLPHNWKSRLSQTPGWVSAETASKPSACI